MQLKPVDTPHLLRVVAEWLAQKENYQWLDFGDGRQLVTPEWLKVAMQRGTHVLRVFTSDADDIPIGVVGLTNVNRHFKTANIWIVLGDRAYGGQGYASRATSRMLTLGFAELGLRSIHTWIVEHNPSIHVARRVNFRLIGRQRQCHYIDGRAYDRLWFDLLASEHEEIEDVRNQPAAAPDRKPVLNGPQP
jgi:RimJ/RimL family protein N-acetyltransferase